MSKDDIERIEYRGYTIRVVRDDDPLNPRKEYDNLGTMVCFHSRYNLGDRHERSKSPKEVLRELASECGTPVNTDTCSDETIHKIVGKHFLMLPLYLYDHSGITMNTSGFSCSWDSGQVGFIYVSHKKIREEYGVKAVTHKTKLTKRPAIEVARSVLRSEVKRYDHYLTGATYGYLVERAGDDHVGSCWGYAGYKNDECSDWDCMLDEARHAVDADIKDRVAKHVHKVKQWIKNRVPFQARVPFEGMVTA